MADGLQNSSTGPPTGTGQPRSISIRAVTIGFIFGAGLAAVGYFNDSVLAMPSLALNHMPLAIYGMLILALLTVHPPRSTGSMPVFCRVKYSSLRFAASSPSAS